MQVKQKRVQISLSEDNLLVISALAEKHSQSIEETVKEMVLKALELEEDTYFSALAEKCEKETKKWISHEDAWK